MEKNRPAAIVAAVTMYLQLEAEAASVSALSGRQQASSPWGLFGRLEIMRARDFQTTRRKWGGVRLASSSEVAAVRTLRPQ
ncbi:MAG: hypothetical protein HYY32_01955 [Chloroflexi bacterium]|nr:hypothetical protein [Chloroflexota bacterium]